jgi:HD-GYP domain-containing protein (c-di-GMP phosphodiesterase class II)
MHVCKLDILKAFSHSFDLLSPALVGHHEQVTYIAVRIGEEMGLEPHDLLDLQMAALVHDVGALQLNTDERVKLLSFETEEIDHAESGFQLLQISGFFEKIAVIVRHHHLHWKDDKKLKDHGYNVPLNSHILHLADRVAVMVNRKREVLSQVEHIRAKIVAQSGRQFQPELVAAFQALAAREYFWLDTVRTSPIDVLVDPPSCAEVQLSSTDFLGLSEVFAQLIDFRSNFTATHSAGVAAVAEKLAELAGFSTEECRHMRIAGNLHDLGKLAIPTEILEKPTALTNDEFNVVKSHTYHSFRILSRIPALATINEWGSFHHERLDGQGYPFHMSGNQLSLGSKIMAIADVFTAITEDRPYRKGMHLAEALKVLDNMARGNALHEPTVRLLQQHIDDLLALRTESQDAAAKQYKKFYRKLRSLVSPVQLSAQEADQNGVGPS